MEPALEEPAAPLPILTPCQACGDQLSYVVIHEPNGTYRLGTWCCLSYVDTATFLKSEKDKAQEIVDGWNKATRGARL